MVETEVFISAGIVSVPTVIQISCVWDLTHRVMSQTPFFIDLKKYYGIL
ncbi:hypothetical protein RU98_GL002115 [Enterococcus caccae]|nr:hypothetical protein RU98_GL002115 [Enterococcus caccae]